MLRITIGPYRKYFGVTWGPKAAVVFNKHLPLILIHLPRYISTHCSISIDRMTYFKVSF